jgi:xylulokinase
MLFLGIDLGASSLKLCLINEMGETQAHVHRPIASASPQPLWVEQNPEDWRQALMSALTEITRETDHKNIAAISVTAGAHIAVLCDANGQAVRPAILWSDQRAHLEAEELRQTGLDIEIAGNQASPTWTLPQLIWLNTHEPDTIARSKSLFFAKDWLRHQLTGDNFTDSGDAAGSMLANHKTNDWDEHLIALAGVAHLHFPQLGNSNDIAGVLKPNLAAELGLPIDIPVAIGSIDTTTEWLCCGAIEAGQMSLKLASAGVVSLTNHDLAPAPPLSLYPHLTAGMAYHAAGMNQCSSAIDWLRGCFSPTQSAQAFEQLASQSPAGANGALFLPYLNGERAPLWRADLTASLSGMTRAHDIGDIARAGFEGIGFAFMDIIESFEARKLSQTRPIFLLGGGSRSDFWCQLLADMLGRELARPRAVDAAFGAGILAMQAYQKAKRMEAKLLPKSQIQKVYSANPEAADFYRQRHQSFRQQRETYHPIA